jgi:pimeloyl-ACP methyl ester carboxylesterase
VTRSGELLATTHHVCVLVPVHPGLGGTHRPDGLVGIPARAELRNGLIELLGLQDVTVTGNSIGGWTTAEIALPRSPRVSGSVLITAAIPDPPPGPCTVPPHVPAPHCAPVKPW